MAPEVCLYLSKDLRPVSKVSPYIPQNPRNLKTRGTVVTDIEVFPPSGPKERVEVLAPV